MRIIKFIGWMLFTAFNAFCFAVFAWTAGNIPAPMTNDNWPFPGWWWSVSIGTVAVIMLICSGYGAMRMLDETLPKGDCRRILSK